MVRPSGLPARELSLCLIACETISGEKRNTEISIGHSLSSFNLTRVAGMGAGELNCLVKAVAISPLWVRDLEEKVTS